MSEVHMGSAGQSGPLTRRSKERGGWWGLLDGLRYIKRLVLSTLASWEDNLAWGGRREHHTAAHPLRWWWSVLSAHVRRLPLARRLFLSNSGGSR